MPLVSDNYKISEESEYVFLNKKEGVSQVEAIIPNIIPKIGVEETQLRLNAAYEKKKLENLKLKENKKLLN